MNSIEIQYNIDSLGRDEILKIQLENLLQSASGWSQSCPYFQELTGNKSISSLSELAQLPFMTGDLLEKYSPPQSSHLLATGGKSGVVLRSGGSTGKRKTIFHSWSMFNKVMSLGARGILANLNTPPRKIANCFPPGNLWGGFLFGNGVADFLGAQLYPMGSNMTAQEIAEIINEAEIDTLFASPSFTHALLTHPDLDPSNFKNLENFLYLGEALTKPQSRQILARFPHLRLQSLAYTANETGCIGYQCAMQNDGYHHIHEDQIVLEIIDPETGAVVPEGTTGELAITTLLNDGMPMIRYRLGDMGRYIGNQCSCGSRTSVVELLGRRDYSSKVCSILMTSSLLTGLLKPLGEFSFDEIQVVTYRKNGGSRIEIFISDEKLRTEQESLARSLLLSHQNFKTLLTFDYVLEILVRATSLRDFLKSPVTGKTKPFIEVDNG